MQVAAFAEQVQIQVPQLRRETIRVVGRAFDTVTVSPSQLVTGRHTATGTPPFEQICIFNAFQWRSGFDNACGAAMGQKRPDNVLLAVLVSAQDFKRVVVPGFDDANQWFGQGSR